MARKRRHEEHENHEAWAIPYGDLVTLLLAFFVVMYALSTINSGKYRLLSDSLSAAFRGTPTSSQMVAVAASSPNVANLMPSAQVSRIITAAMPAHMRFPSSQSGKPAPGSLDSGEPATSATAGTPANGNDDLAKVQVDVSRVLGPLIQRNLVRVNAQGQDIEIEISADILFSSGSADLEAPAVPVLRQLAAALRPSPNLIRVEGHTDDRPISSTAFRSNWELSATRAATVIHLFVDRGVDPHRLAVGGYGEFKPVQSNVTPEGRNANRRVAIIILGRNDATVPGIVNQ